MLWAHLHDVPPVGRVIRTEIEGDNVTMTIEGPTLDQGEDDAIAKARRRMLFVGEIFADDDGIVHHVSLVNYATIEPEARQDEKEQSTRLASQTKKLDSHKDNEMKPSEDEITKRNRLILSGKGSQPERVERLDGPQPEPWQRQASNPKRGASAPSDKLINNHSASDRSTARLRAIDDKRRLDAEEYRRRRAAERLDGSCPDLPHGSHEINPNVPLNQPKQRWREPAPAHGLEVQLLHRIAERLDERGDSGGTGGGEAA